MKKQSLVLPVICILFFLICNIMLVEAQSNTSTLDKELRKMVRGKVKEIIETNTAQGSSNTITFRYNDQGQLISQLQNIGGTDVNISFKYNTDGKITQYSSIPGKKNKDYRRSDVDYSLNIESINERPFGEGITNFIQRDWATLITYQYANGKLTKEKGTVNSDDNRGYATSTYKVKYHPNGKIRKYTSKSKGERAVWTYNEKGDLLTKKLPPDFDDGEWIEKECPEVEKYDSLGRLVTTTNINCETLVYQYNTFNFLTHQQRYSDDIKGETKTYQDYVYDNNKNWIQRTILINREYFKKIEIKITSTRKINYYN